MGKRARRPAIAQSTINALILRAARRGQTVVRLKSGDPFVLGRGGEEALFCRDTGVPCEIIPGISSAIAGPASVGIPVTHRELAPGFLVLSAVPARHCETVLRRIDPGSVTVVLLMALGSREAIASFLRREGWPAELPAAIVLGATSDRQWSWNGHLAGLVDAEIPLDREDLPGLIVLGPVVSKVAISRFARTLLGNACKHPRSREPHVRRSCGHTSLRGHSGSLRERRDRR